MTSIFWDNVFNILNKLDKTQKWLADESKVGKTAINSGISRKSSPSADNALKIAQALGTSVEYLITGSEGSSLTQEEQELIAKYKNLSRENKRNVRALVDSMLSVPITGKK